MMKLPNEETPQNHLNGDGYISDDYEHLEMMPAPIRNGDFSEYMWMENEEEFDTQVLRELEEQELMEECLAAMLNEPNDEAEGQNGGDSHANNSRTNDSLNSSVNGLSDSVNTLSLSSNGVRNNSSDNFNSSHSQNAQDSPRYTAQSRLSRVRPASQESDLKSNLNPDAKEFVPNFRSTVTSQEEEKVPS